MKKIDAAIIALLSIVFLSASIDKLLHYEGFVNALTNYKLVPPNWATPIAVPIIAIEFLVGTSLLSRRLRLHASMTATILLAVFTLALLINQLYGERGICGCWFTITLGKDGAAHIVQNVLLLAMSISTWITEASSTRKKLTAVTARSENTWG